MATPTLAHFAADTEIEPLMAALRRDGAAIVDDVIAPDALAALGAAGIHFKDLRSSESSLEEIFVGLVNAPQAAPASTKVAA